MATTTHPDFSDNTEAIEVADAFSSGIRGKIVLVTGVNRGGIGFSTSQAFVCEIELPVIPIQLTKLLMRPPSRPRCS